MKRLQWCFAVLLALVFAGNVFAGTGNSDIASQKARLNQELIAVKQEAKRLYELSDDESDQDAVIERLNALKQVKESLVSQIRDLDRQPAPVASPENIPTSSYSGSSWWDDFCDGVVTLLYVIFYVMIVPTVIYIMYLAYKLYSRFTSRSSSAFSGVSRNITRSALPNRALAARANEVAQNMPVRINRNNRSSSTSSGRVPRNLV